MTKEEIIKKLSEYNNFNNVNELISNISIDKLSISKNSEIDGETSFIYRMIITDNILLCIGVYSDDINQDTWFNLYSYKELLISDFRTMDWIVKFIVSTQKKIRENGF